MSSQQPLSSRLAALSACGISLIVLIVALAGCSGQDRVIGEGDHQLVFTNEGDISVPITVRWAGIGDRIQTERFTVLVDGRVTLKTMPRLSYDIELDPDCNSSASAAQAPVAQDDVIDLRR